MKRFIWVFLICSLSFALEAQADLHEATRAIHKEFKFADNSSLVVNGRRANIFLQTHQKNSIIVDIDIISKHPDLKQAEADIEKLEIMSEKVGTKISLSNYISIGRKEKAPESDLRVIYTVYLPPSCPVDLRNVFGEIDIAGIQADLDVDVKYSTVTVHDTKAIGTIKSLLGNVKLSNTDGYYDLELSRSDLDLKNAAGVYAVHSEYGMIHADVIDNIQMLKIKGEGVDVVLSSNDLESSGYVLQSQGGDISIDPAFKSSAALHTEKDKRSVSINDHIDHSNLNIETKYGNISLKKGL